MSSPSDGPAAPAVQAAGGIVTRMGSSGPEVLLVHRPRYDDWSLPKGKLLPGEDHQTAALREVAEETGLQCSLQEEAGEVSYRDRHGRPKTVRYWFMAATGGKFAPNDEVDRLRWEPLESGAGLLTHHQDRQLLQEIHRRGMRDLTRKEILP